MNLTEYVEQVKKTQIYHDCLDERYHPLYSLTGLHEEFGEFMRELIKKENDKEATNRDFIVTEAGDTFWYLTSFSLDMKLNPSEVFNFTENNIVWEESVEVCYDLLSRISGKVKKMYRNKNNTDSVDIKLLVSKFSQSFYNILRFHRIDLSTIRSNNISKTSNKYKKSNK